MFKKLKDKIAEEVKISPQRMQQIQQFTQSVTDKLQQGLEQGATAADDGLFSISEDDARHVNSGLLASVPLWVSTSAPDVSHHKRRNSNSSIASDVSFLPQYEPAMNSYHLQSDLDASASEVEDNVPQQASTLGEASKEQVHLAFQKAQMQYHKYRGRYTDLASHYRELERENSKMRAVLVETQDKAIRRVCELKEQCVLSQRAKADIEAALRIEIEEKVIIIDTLKQKVDLLQEQGEQNGSPNTSTLIANGNGAVLADLNDRLQEYKANSIISKEKLSELQKELDQAKKCLLEYEEKEKNSNLKFAKSKMDLHTELQNRELEIANLKCDLESVRSDLEVYEQNGGGLKAQNTNLIEKCETLKRKNHDLEAELLKTAQYQIEVQSLHQQLRDDRSANSREVESLRKMHAEELKNIQEDTKQSLVSLQERIKCALADEYQQKEVRLKEQFQSKLEQLNQAGDSLKQMQIRLMQAEDAVRGYEVNHKDDQDALNALSEKNVQLEKDYIALMHESDGRRGENALLSARIKGLEGERAALECTAKSLAEGTRRLEDEISGSKAATVALERDLTDQIERLTQEVGALAGEETERRRAEGENLRLLQDIEGLQKEVGVLNTAALQAADALARMEGDVALREKQLNDALERNLLLEEENASLEKGRTVLKQTVEDLQMREDSKNARLAEENAHQLKSVADLTANYVALESKCHRLQHNEGSLLGEIQALENCRHDSHQLAAAQNAEIAMLTAALDAANESIQTLNSSNTMIRQQLEELTSKIDELDVLQEKLGNVQDDYAKLQNQVVAMRQEAADALATEDILREQLSAAVGLQTSAEMRWRNEKERLIEQLEALTQDLQAAQRDLQADALHAELKEMRAGNERLAVDNKRLMEENDKLLSESSDMMLQLATKIANTDAEVAAKLADVTAQYSTALDDANRAKGALAVLRTEAAAYERHVSDLEKHVAELEQERQFLKDEIDELKTTPVHTTTASSATASHQPRDQSGGDVASLQAKLLQYKTIDQTNRSSIAFYEGELQKLQAKNDKLNRRLDETLVTLNHCADLSASTEVEYLKNVVYNYMLGKESMVLARVIAAVCKFDRQQTDAVLKHEQQKQTLLGQLGIL